MSKAAPNRIRDIYEAACVQDIGTRREQQDRVEILWSESACLAVLADGMGGEIRAAFAAQSVIDAVSERFVNESAQITARELLASAVEAAHILVHSGERNFALPGSTCVLLHLTPSQATWTSVGDSRLYHFRDGRYRGRTLDHTAVDMDRHDGLLSEGEARVHPAKNELFSHLGGVKWPQYQVESAELSERDSFLLCSDGLWENVDTEDMESALKAGDLDSALCSLVSQARSQGGKRCDNISVAAIRRKR